VVPHHVWSREAEQLFNVLDDDVFNTSEQCIEQKEHEEVYYSLLMKWRFENPQERGKLCTKYA